MKFMQTYDTRPINQYYCENDNHALIVIKQSTYFKSDITASSKLTPNAVE